MKTLFEDREPPAGWRRVALGYVTGIDYGYPFAAENFTSDETAVPVIRIRDVKPGAIQTYATGESPHPGAWVGDGDIVIGMDGDFNHVRWSAGRAAMNQRVCALRPGEAAESRFLDYAIGIPLTAINETVHYTTVKHLSMEALRGKHVFLPPLDTQRRIADMLDAETARIDTLIAKNERVLSTAVTREKVAVSEAIGSGGLHVGRWRTGALRWFDVDIQTGPFGSQLHAEEYVAGGWPVCNPSNIRDGRLVADESVTIGEEAWSRLARHHLRPGDILFGRRGEMGRAALVTDAEQGWVCGTGCLLVRLRNTDRYIPEFLMEVLSSWGVRAWFDQKSVGSTMQNLNEGVLGSLPVPSVPVDEQRRVLDKIRSIRESHALLRSLVDRQQELLRLRREALITAAVTGQIEV